MTSTNPCTAAAAVNSLLTQLLADGYDEVVLASDREGARATALRGNVQRPLTKYSRDDILGFLAEMTERSRMDASASKEQDGGFQFRQTDGAILSIRVTGVPLANGDKGEMRIALDSRRPG
jgi:hypothetical protein